MHIILDTWVTEIRRIPVQDSLGKKARPYLQKKQNKKVEMEMGVWLKW
jgi:hypothetical protein